MTRAMLSILGALGAALASTAQAHHSYAEFDRCRSVSIEGRIERVLWANPHVVLTLVDDDGNTHRIEWLDARRLTRTGVGDGALARGDRIAVTASTHRDPAIAVLTLVTEIRRVDGDDWRWARPGRRGSAEVCAEP